MNTSHQGSGATELCREGDKLLAAGDLGRATALYIHAFGRHAGSTMAHMRGLDRPPLAKVVSTLEGWLNGYGTVQDSAEGISKGLAAVFLSTLCPNNISASLFKMESVLHRSGQSSDDIFARCSALLEAKRSPQPEGPTCLILELTRALACLLSESHNHKAPLFYLKAFQKNKAETVRLVKCRQAQHVPRLVKMISEQISQKCPIFYSASKAESSLNLRTDNEEIAASDMIELLTGISPNDTQVRELQAAFLFSTGKFEESAEAFSLALQLYESQTEKKSNVNQLARGMTPERRARILIGRAAANLSAGGRASEVCYDLGESFAVHPAAARQHFQLLFSDSGTGAAVRIQLRQQAERGLSGFREMVQLRPDLRSCKGVELLDPVISQLRALCHLEPDGGGRELRVRLAECLLLRGEFREALSICSQLAAAASVQQSYQNTVQVLRGYARLLSEDHKGALEDFQAVIEHSAPHPPSCVRALCGRGLLRMMAGSHYLTTLDYVTASRLQHQDTALTVRCLIPWNCRGLLCTVLVEQGRTMLEEAGVQNSSSCPVSHQEHQQNDQQRSSQGKEAYLINKEGTPVGVHALALLLMELQPGEDAHQILTADALYQLDRVEEAYRLLLSIERTSQRSPILVRLALLQLHRGFHYDANQLLKKLIQCGDTSCLRSLLSVAAPKDRALLERHCYKVSKRILDGRRDESTLREAVAYLSIAIMASGGEATESLLKRARCYALLGQHKTAIFDFTAVLKEHPDHVQALCGRGFTYLMLNQQKESTQDILAALQVGAEEVIQSIMSLKDKAQKLICEWLQQRCRSSLSETLAAHPVPCQGEHLREAFVIGGALMKTDCKDSRWHLLYIDILLANGEVKAASDHLKQVFGREPRELAAQARWGVVEAWQQNFGTAAKRLSVVAEKETPVLTFLLFLVHASHRKHLAQAASQAAGIVSESGQWERALCLLTVAVQATCDGTVQYQRQRAACLAQLGFHERAVSDMDNVIHLRSTENGEEQRAWAEDLCRRGCSLLQCSREEAGLQDLSRALELNQDQALQCMETELGRSRLAEVFLRYALQSYGEQQLSKAWGLTESGLRVDSSHPELRRLRARIKREVSAPCIVH